MLTGGMFPLLAIEIPFAKYIMYFSVLSLGLLLANAYKTSIITGGLIVAVVALFHGYVHVYDMMLDVSDSGYMTGFAVATLLLIIAGILSRYLLNYVFSRIGDGALMKDESE
jgi:urease accessory protein